MTRPDISVIVPVYKVEPYLRKCLDSILAQTLRNVEIILVDDGSPDHCGAICDEYAAKDDRITVIHQQNAGASAARNAGLRIATGRYLAFVDSDDWLEDDMYEYLLSLAEETKADLVQCGIFWEENGQTEKQFVLPEDKQISGVRAFTEEDWKSFSNSASNKLYRADAAQDVRFPEDCSWGEDLLYNIEVLLRSRRVCLGSKAKYHYFQHSDSACHTQVGEEYFTVRCDAIIRATELLGYVPASFAHFFTMHMEVVLDMASKLIVSGSRDRKLEKILRQYTRRGVPALLQRKLLSRKDRLKSVLLAYAWPLYRPLLLASKK